MSESRQAAAPGVESKSSRRWVGIFRHSRDTPLRRMAKEFGAVRARRSAGEPVSVRGRWVDLVSARSPRTDDDRVVVHHHIRKTGGTTLRKTILSCYPASARLVVAYPDAARDELGRGGRSCSG